MQPARRYRNRRAVSVVFLGISALTLCAFAGLAIDVGHWYHTRARLQSCADAAALAGSTQLPDAVAAADVARDFVALNGVQSGEIVSLRALPDGASEPKLFEVVVRRSAGPFFLAVVGLRRVLIDARAVAESTTRTRSGPGTGQGNAFDFAVYAGREFAPKSKRPELLKFTGTNVRVEGALHTNGSFESAGSDSSFTGPVTAGHDLDDSGSGHRFLGGARADAPRVPMPALDTHSLAAEAKANGTYYRYDTASSMFQVYDPAAGGFVPASPPPGATFSGDKIHFANQPLTLSSTLYVENGGVQFNGSDLMGAATVIADGPISVSVSGLSYTGSNELAFISLSTADTAITVSGSDSAFHGAFFAPAGGIDLSGQNLSIQGAVIGDHFSNVSGQDITISYDPSQVSRIPVQTTADTFVRLVE